MAQFDEIRWLASKSRSRVAEDRAALRRLAQELSYTDHVIERATLAYNVSLWTLEKVERSYSRRSAAPSSLVSNFAAERRPGSSSK
jgi:predicted nucleic acid-binding protein